MNQNDVIDLRFTTIQEEVPDFIYEGLKEYVKESYTYHPQPDFLREELAKRYHITKNQIFLTNDVDEALRICVKLFGEQTHVFTPTEYSTTYQFCPTLKTHYSLKNNIYQIGQLSLDIM